MIQMNLAAGVILLMVYIGCALAIAFLVPAWRSERRRRKSAEEVAARHLRALHRYWDAEDRSTGRADLPTDLPDSRPCPICGTPMAVAVELSVRRRIRSTVSSE